jgi:hypothetical protein
MNIHMNKGALQFLPPTGIALFQNILLGTILGEWASQRETIQDPYDPSQDFQSELWPRFRSTLQILAADADYSQSLKLNARFNAENTSLLDTLPLLLRFHGDFATQAQQLQQVCKPQPSLALEEAAKLLGYWLTVLPIELTPYANRTEHLTGLARSTPWLLPQEPFSPTASLILEEVQACLAEALPLARAIDRLESLGENPKEIQPSLPQAARNCEQTQLAIALLCVLCTPKDLWVSLQRGRYTGYNPKQICPLIGALSGAVAGSGIDQFKLPPELKQEILEAGTRLFRAWAGCHRLETSH